MIKTFYAPADLRRHPLSAAWQDMAANDRADLVRDVQERGVVEPIVIHDGMVLDGWHRYTASGAGKGQPCPAVNYAGDDPAGFVIARNALRRQMSATERAKAVVRCREWVKPSGEKPKPGEATNKELAAEARASVGTVQRAKREIREERGETPKAPAKKKAAKKVAKKAAAKPAPTPSPDAIRAAAQAERIREAEEEAADQKARAEMLKDQLSGDPAVVEQKWNAARAEVKTLRASLASEQQKCKDLRRERTNLKRELRQAQKRIAELEKAAAAAKE